MRGSSRDKKKEMLKKKGEREVEKEKEEKELREKCG